MIVSAKRFATLLNRFRDCEDGGVTVEFVIVFPVFIFLFLMTFESGMISLRHFALERAVDLAVREVRIGILANPTRNDLRARICEFAGILPDCENQMQIEMVQLSLRVWNDVDPVVRCIDRGTVEQPDVDFVNGGNNELIFLRACIRLDPYLPTTGIGRAIVQSNDNASAGGSYALISTAAFVVEPFQLMN